MPTLEELQLDSNIFQIVGFRLNGVGEKHLFGINVAKVREIIENKVRINRIPGLPSSVPGTFQLRDKIIPLVDLASAIGLTQSSTHHDDVENRAILVTEFSNRLIGFLVHDVDRIKSLPANEMEKPSSGIDNDWLDFIVFFARFKDGQIMSILDFEKVTAELGLSSKDIMSASLPIDENLSQNSTPKKILLAEDSSFIRHRLVRLLETYGHTVEQCVDGQEAWEKLEEWANLSEIEQQPIENYVQLISSDIEMPRVDGMTLLVRTKNDPRFKHLPFVIISTLSTDEQKRKCMDGGASDYLVKLEANYLIKSIQEHAL